MNLFKHTKDKEEVGINTLEIPWQSVDVISSNCPVHMGVRLKKLGDNNYICPKGSEIYHAHGSVANQSNRDRYDTHVSRVGRRKPSLQDSYVLNFL